MTPREKKLVEAMREIEAECTHAIAHEATLVSYKIGGPNLTMQPDDIPNGFRTVAHIKLSMIRETVRNVLAAYDEPKEPPYGDDGGKIKP